MRKTADLLEERQKKYGRLMTTEMGKPITAAIAEVTKCALVCRYYLEMSEEETARAMNISRGTVKSTTSRAVAALGRILGEEQC